MIGTTQSICGCLDVSNSAQSLRRHGRRDLGLPVSGDACPCKFKATRSQLPHPKLRCNHRCPSSVEFLPREPQNKDQLANGERFPDMLIDSKLRGSANPVELTTHAKTLETRRESFSNPSYRYLSRRRRYPAKRHPLANRMPTSSSQALRGTAAYANGCSAV
jgi:hypothetical protein